MVTIKGTGFTAHGKRMLMKMFRLMVLEDINKCPTQYERFKNGSNTERAIQSSILKFVESDAPFNDQGPSRNESLMYWNTMNDQTIK